MSGCSFIKVRDAVKPPIESGNIDSSNVDAISEGHSGTSGVFMHTGAEEMHICDARSVCHRGQVSFEDGNVSTFVDRNGVTIIAEDSVCDDRSCYVEDEKGKEWDFIRIQQ